MNKGHLLDTNIVIGLFAGDPDITGAFETVEYAGLSVVVYAELLAGALRSARIADNVSRLERFSHAVPMIDCDRNTAAVFADFSVALRKKGRPIPENDIWIAATAQQHGLVLVSRDQHFREIDSLMLEEW